MTTWTTAAITRICGRCGRSVPAGEPMHAYQIAGLTRVLLRCTACDGPEQQPEPKTGDAA